MNHYIIVKFKENTEKEKLVKPIKDLFTVALNINEIKSIDIYTSNIELPNRYDLMIKMELSKPALKEFDNSEIHKKWKEEYSKYIASKTIFDCE